MIWFVRGRGCGHALDGLAIARELRRLASAVEIRWVSYGTGAATLREHGETVTDLELPDNPGLFAVEARLPALLDGARDIVVAHEEFDVPLAARQRGWPCLFLTDWFLSADDWRMRALEHSTSILFLDEESGVFPAPPGLAGRISWCGPRLRSLRYSRADRDRARREAGLPADALVAAVFIRPGRRTEEVAPLRAALEAAFGLLEGRDKLLLWDHDGDDVFDRTMAACDLAITKGNRNLVLELASLGVPVVTVSHGLNLIDDRRASALANVRTLSHADLTPERLAEAMRQQMTAGPFPARAFSDGAFAAAQRIADAAVGDV